MGIDSLLSADGLLVLDDPNFLADRYAVYEQLRRKAPIQRAKVSYFDGVELYVVARYRDCVELTTDTRFRRVIEGAEPLPYPPAIRFMITDSMVHQDNPQHLRLRTLVNRAFTPKAIAALSGRVQQLTSTLLDGFTTGSTVDVLEQYALPIPMTVISEMVGVAEADRARFHDGMTLVINGMATYGLDAMAAKLEELIDFVRHIVVRRRSEPADDILTALIHAREEGDQLSDDELVVMVLTLITAGYETTYHLIANGIAALLCHRDQLELLKTSPPVIDSAVEEILRYTGTIGGTKPNYANEDVQWHDVLIPRGAMVIPLLDSANRDPDIFDHPDVFDITRSPNQHIAFSKGPHFCLGAHLARMETRVAISNLVNRFPNLELSVDPDQLQYAPVPFWRRLTELPVTVK